MTAHSVGTGARRDGTGAGDFINLVLQALLAALRRDEGRYVAWEAAMENAICSDGSLPLGKPAKKLVLLEVGCGLTVPSVRSESRHPAPSMPSCSLVFWCSLIFCCSLAFCLHFHAVSQWQLHLQLLHTRHACAARSMFALRACSGDGVRVERPPSRPRTGYRRRQVRHPQFAMSLGILWHALNF